MQKQGFTLLDLLIAIAIIGVLSTVAIPTYTYYVAQSKTSEAYIHLNNIAKGAISYFEAEHVYRDSFDIRSHEYPSIKNVARLKGIKAELYRSNLDALGGMPYTDADRIGGYAHYPGHKNDPTTPHNQECFNAFPWKDLHFTIDSPFYYAYNYQGGNWKNEGNSTTGKSYFAATASACLIRKCDNKYECDSGYIILGGPHGGVSQIIDNSDFVLEPQCGKAIMSDIHPKTPWVKDL